MSAQAFALLLEDGNVDALRSAWAQIAPHLPQPGTRAEAEMVMHTARTAANSVTFPKRAYSHRWLIERNLPSQLPDALRARAQRMYPKIVSAVGIACKSKYPEVALAVRTAMEDAVKEAYADGKQDDIVHVKRRMAIAREHAVQHLFGRRG